jgi:hypothetical protein
MITNGLNFLSIHKWPFHAIPASITSLARQVREMLVRHAGVRIRAMPPICFNLQKIARFWIGNSPVPTIKPCVGTI